MVNFLLSATTANQAQENITLASEMRVISQQIAKNALEAAAGNADAFELLAKSQQSFQSAWDDVKDEPVENPEVKERLSSLWSEVNSNAGTILRGKIRFWICTKWQIPWPRPFLPCKRNTKAW